MSAGLKWLCVAVAIPVAAVLAAIYGAYWYGASALPATIRPSEREYPAELRRMYWQSMGGTGEIRIRRLNPLTMAWTMFRMVEDANDGRMPPSPPDLQVLTIVSRIRVSTITPQLPTSRRHFAEIALMIRTSREWSSKQILDTTLAELWYGRGARGLDQAAETYFGIGTNELSPEESQALFAIERGPSYYDPTCHRARFVERYRFIAKRTGLREDEKSIERATTRLHAISCQ
ncbi:MAG: transglycosylase domain-containing protein [Thermomonas sp.]